MESKVFFRHCERERWSAIGYCVKSNTVIVICRFSVRRNIDKMHISRYNEISGQLG